MKTKHTNQSKLVIKNEKIFIKNSLNESITDTAYNAGKGLVGDIGKAYEALYNAAERYVRTFLIYPLRVIRVLFTDEKLKDVNSNFRQKDKELSDDMNRTINSMEGASDAKMFLAITKPEVLIATPAVNKINYYIDKINNKIQPNKEDIKIINNEINLINFYIFIYRNIANKKDIDEIETLFSYNEKKEINATKENIKGLQRIIINKLNERNNINTIIDFFNKNIYDFIKNREIHDLTNEEINFLKIIIKNNSENKPSFVALDIIKKTFKITQQTSETEKNIKIILSLKEKLKRTLDKQRVNYRKPEEDKKPEENSDKKEQEQNKSPEMSSSETPDVQSTTSTTQTTTQNSSYSRLNINNKNIKIIYENEENTQQEDSQKESSIEQLMDNVKFEYKCHYTYLLFMNAFCGIAMNNYQMTFAVSLYAFYSELLNKLYAINNNTELANIDDFDSIKKIKKLNDDDSVLENYINEVVLKNNEYKEFLNLSIIEQQLQLNKKAINDFYNKNKQIIEGIKTKTNENQDINILLATIYDETVKQITDEGLTNTKKLTETLDNVINIIQQIKLNYDNDFINQNLDKLEGDIPAGEGKIISEYRITTLSKMINNINELKTILTEINISDIINRIKEKSAKLKTESAEKQQSVETEQSDETSKKETQQS